jgi:hypothetical protein
VAVAITNSVASNNFSAGIYVQNTSGTLTVSIDNAKISNNTYGINANGIAKVLLGRSVITGNGTGISNSTSPSTIYTYGNNRINLNGANNNGNIGGSALNTTYLQQ